MNGFEFAALEFLKACGGCVLIGYVLFMGVCGGMGECGWGPERYILGVAVVFVLWWLYDKILEALNPPAAKN